MTFSSKGSWFLREWRKRHDEWLPWAGTTPDLVVGEELICNVIANSGVPAPSWSPLPEYLNQDIRRIPQQKVDEAKALHFVAQTHVGPARGTKHDAQKRWAAAFAAMQAACKPKCTEAMRAWDAKLLSGLPT